MRYKDLNFQKERIRKFLRKNPKATWNDIRIKLHIHPERIYKNGLSEAFKDAKVKPPRNFKRKTPEENRNIIINYIKKHPNTSSHKILNNTKVNPSSFFNSIRKAFNAAEVIYPRDIKKTLNRDLVEKRQINHPIILKNIIEKNKKVNPKEIFKNIGGLYSEKNAIRLQNQQFRLINKENKKKEIIRLIKEDPLITIPEIIEKTKTHLDYYFKNMEEIYNKAKIKFINGHKKRTLRKKRLVIEYIRKNPLSTQKEINKACRTHIQETFKNGIFEAYKKADIKYPYERLRLYGTATKEIRKRSGDFEDSISNKLQGYGKVNRLVKTKRGVADIIFERKNKKAIIEIKDYQAKDISISQVKQVLKYLEDCSCNLGVLICHKKPKRDNFLIGENKIFIIEENELDKIPLLMGL